MNWISCEEKLPELETPVLVTTDEEIVIMVTLEKYDENEMIWNTCEKWEYSFGFDEIIAWQPLPEPYKQTGEKKGGHAECRQEKE